MGFQADVYHNKYLPEGHRVLHAVISVSTTRSGERRGQEPAAAQVIMIDCSGSMGAERITEAKRATMAAVDMLRDEVAFAIVKGTSHASMVYPPGETMVPASSVTRQEAREAIRNLYAEGGTAIGTWLELANTLFRGQDADIKHAILLTDGHNEHQQPHELDATLARCRGQFVCDSRGVGKDWRAKPLRAIADALHGSAKGLPDAGVLSAEFRAMTKAFMGTNVADVAIRLWCPRNARVLALKQDHPHIVDLTERRAEVDGLTSDYPIGSWGEETREYLLSVELPPGNRLFDEVLAAHVRIVVNGQELAEALVPAVWTDDRAMSTKIDQRVAHVTGQVELDDVTQQGLAALEAGRVEEATTMLGRAVQLAHESDHQDTLRVLRKVVDVQDAAAAKVTLRRGMEQVDAEMAALQSRMTVRWQED